MRDEREHKYEGFRNFWMAACARYTAQYSDLVVSSSSLVPGNWYYIIVDNYANPAYQGSFTLCVDDTIDYDFREAAIELTDLNNWCSPEAAYTTMNATADELKGSCWNSGPNYNRWFKFQATTTEALVQLKIGGTEGSMRYPYIALWDDSNTEVACSRYSSQYSDISIGTTSLIPGNWYYISVDNLNNPAYRGSFTLCLNDAVDYDFKAGAIELTGYENYCSTLKEFSTLNATPDELKGTCWNTGPNYNRWFKFQATSTEFTVIMKTGAEEGTLRYPYLALWDDANNEIACRRYAGAYDDLEISVTGLTIGDWYYISADNHSSAGYRGSFSLCTYDKLSYDFKDGAIELSDFNGWCSSEAAFSTINATPDETAGSCWPNGPNYNRWFKFQATGPQMSIQVRTNDAEGTLRRPVVALWDNTLTEVSCNVYSTDNSDIEIAATSLTTGNWYYVSVDNNNGAGYRGSFTLCATDHIINDDKVNAIEITDMNSWCSDSARYSNIIATDDGGIGSCFTGAVNKNVWFKINLYFGFSTLTIGFLKTTSFSFEGSNILTLASYTTTFV